MKTNTYELICKSLKLKNLIGMAHKVAKTNAAVFIKGETGTGKELIANYIHYNSKRNTSPFIKVNCAAIQDTLLESELFGHEKGSFTGADRQKLGKFEIANQGTLFLDEISNMSLAIQAKILRTIEYYQFERIGGLKSINVDTRLVSASNSDVEQDIKDEKFRSDLFYRISTIILTIPPLRDRKEDIDPITDYYINLFSNQLQRNPPIIKTEARRALYNYNWPGNIRELKNTIERATILCDNEITSDLFEFNIEQTAKFQNSNENLIKKILDSFSDNKFHRLENLAITTALKAHKGVQAYAADYLGITKRIMHYKVQRNNLKELCSDLTGIERQPYDRNKLDIVYNQKAEEIIQKHKNGINVSRLAKEYNIDRYHINKIISTQV